MCAALKRKSKNGKSSPHTPQFQTVNPNHNAVEWTSVLWLHTCDIPFWVDNPLDIPFQVDNPLDILLRVAKRQKNKINIKKIHI